MLIADWVYLLTWLTSQIMLIADQVDLLKWLTSKIKGKFLKYHQRFTNLQQYHWV